MGFKQIIVVFVLLCFAVPGFCQDEECQIGGEIFLPLIGVEDPTNLLQFAYPCFYYLLNSSDKVVANNLRPAYESNNLFVVESPPLTKVNYGGTCPSSGTNLIGLCHYSENTGELTQRAWYAVRTITLTEQFVTGIGVEFVEVPPVSVSDRGSGIIRISWNAVPPNNAVSKYRIVRSPDGLSNWATVGDTTALYLDDSPGNGRWYYALEIVFAGTPTVFCSRHGLLASILMEEQ